MTDFFSQIRKRIGDSPDGRVCWLGCQIAIPALHILPVEEASDKWMVEVIVEGRWVGCYVTGGELLNNLLASWRADPEYTLKEWFLTSPPSSSPTVRVSAGAVRLETVVEATAEDLGL